MNASTNLKIEWLWRFVGTLCAVFAWLSVAHAADSLVFVGGNDGSDIASYRLDAQGSLHELARTPSDGKPSFLAWSLDHRHLYAVNETSHSNVVLSFAIDQASGKLTRTGVSHMGESGQACWIGVHPSGRWVFTASVASGHISLLPVKKDGSLGDAVAVVKAGPGAHMVAFNHEGSVLLVPTMNNDQVQVYRFNITTGQPTHATSFSLEKQEKKHAGVRHCALSPDERFFYTINEFGSSISEFSADLATLTFKSLGTISTVPSDYHGKNICAHIVIAPDGKILYGSNRGHDSLVICRIGDTGTLDIVGHETVNGTIPFPRHFALTSDGAFAIVASLKANTLTVLRVNPASGKFSLVGSQNTIPSPVFVGVMPLP